MATPRVQTVQAQQEDAGERLDRFLASKVPGLTLERARQLADEGRVRIRGKTASFKRKLWGNELIELDLPGPEPVHVATDAPEVPLLYADADLVVVDKPAGLVVESEGKGRSVAEIVGARLGGCEVAGVAAPGVVHRLDRETSGCLALARTDAAWAALEAAFQSKRIQKRYLALVLGEPPDSLRLEGPYGRDPADPRRFTTRARSARRAALSFKVEERFPGAALLEVALETGRTHQIRVQLSEAGFPVLADALYGQDAARHHPAAQMIGRQALHAVRLQLPAPSGTEVAVEAPLPSDFARSLAWFRRA
ncbi:MAG: RluA family pseudouridine synthase [Deltaproteobacteria bacterium]|nr:RluA family pseudouridine synthase [Deltaproteobacteria bacterium]